jgi:hypothetical protein
MLYKGTTLNSHSGAHSRLTEVVRLLDLCPAAIYPQEDSWYSFLLEAESTPAP